MQTTHIRHSTETTERLREGGTANEPRRAEAGPRIGVVIPSFRVAPYLAGVIREIPAYVSVIVVVDDCSPDDIASAVAEAADPRVTLVRHERNQGVGGAVLTGYRKAVELGAEILVKVDGDGQMDPARIEDLIAPIEDGRADYTKGNRFLHFAELKSMPFHRRLGNTLLSFLAKSASGYWPIFDPANGYTALHHLAWQRLRDEKLARRYFFETSLLIELGCLRAVVEDVPIPARYQGEISSLRPAQVVMEFPPKLGMGLLRRIGTWYFLYDFTPVSVFLVMGPLFVLFALAWGGAHWLHAIQTGIPTPTGTIMLAVVSLVLGVQLLLQALVIDMQNVPQTPIQRTATRTPSSHRRA